MLAILNRYKLFLIILTLIVLTVLILLFITSQNNDKIPTRGVFVMIGRLLSA
jgi:cell division protein FtsN